MFFDPPSSGHIAFSVLAATTTFSSHHHHHILPESSKNSHGFSHNFVSSSACNYSINFLLLFCSTMVERSVKYLATISLFLFGTSEFSVVDGLSTTATTQQQTRQALTETITAKPLSPRTRSQPRTTSEQPDEDELFGFFEVSSFQELQRSMGPEILDDELQHQIELAKSTPNLFLDAHVSDASYIEKVAMSSIPQQLPQPAVYALLQQQQQLQTKATLRMSKAQRLTHSEELELAQMIQRGVRLHRLKADYEDARDQKMTRHQWAALAGMESATQLRREVATYRRAKQLLVSANVGLVHAVVKKQLPSLRKKGMTYEEGVQEGSLGLLRAAELFDPSRGLRFSTYATIWIKGALGNSHMSEAIKLPARARTKWNKIVQAHDELVKEKGMSQEPTPEEVANRVGMSVEDVVIFQRKMKQAKHVLSLDYEYKQQSRSGADVGNSDRLLENDKNFQSDADLAERTQMQADVIAAMARNLTPREARLMRLRYGLADGQQRSLRECAEAMGLSESRVQTLAKDCLKKLREAAEAESLEEYLLTIA
jgi:RNA polymerase primary sigma factor